MPKSLVLAVLTAVMAITGVTIAQTTQPAATETTAEAPATQPAADTATEAAAEAKPEPKFSDKQNASYALGVMIGYQSMRQQMPLYMDVDEEQLFAGLSDCINEKDLRIENQALMTSLQGYLMKWITETGEKNKAEGEIFLAKNGNREGVITTESGLQYEVVKEGTGASPAATDTVTVNYEGTLLNGEVFDASEKHGQPAEFQLNRVIDGWTEGVQLMKEGGKLRLFVPSKLAYRDAPHGPGGPHATLIFEVELLKVTKTAAAPALPFPAQPQGG